MKTLQLFLCVLTFSLPSWAQAQTAQKTGHDVDAAINLMRSMNLDKTWNDVIKSVVAQMSQGHQELEQPLLKFYQKIMSYPAIEPGMAKIYAKHYTVSELGELATFYSTPVGKKSLAIMPVVMSESMQMGQDMVKAHQEELKQVIQEALKKSQESKKK